MGLGLTWAAPDVFVGIAYSFRIDRVRCHRLELSPDGRRVLFTLTSVDAIQVLATDSNQIGRLSFRPPL